MSANGSAVARRGAGLFVFVVIACLVASGRGPVPASAGPPPAATESVAVEIVLNADRAVWRPKGRRGARFKIEQISPRMAVMTVAPHRRVAVLPAGMLSANWRRMFRGQRGWTNVIASMRDPGGRRRLVPLAARLVRGPGAGHRMVFEVRRLQRRGHRPDRLGRHRMVFEDVTLLVDPTITDAIRALWNALVEFFAGKVFDIAPNPVRQEADASWTYDPGDFYDGARVPHIENVEPWKLARDMALGEARYRSDADFTEVAFQWDVDRVAVFSDTLDSLSFFPDALDPDLTDARVNVTNSAFHRLTVDTVMMRNADLGGVNMRGLEANKLDARHSVLKSVDLTGAEIGVAGGERSNMSESVWDGVFADRVVRDADGDPDAESHGARFRNVDFTNTMFRDVHLSSASISGSAFPGCSFDRVDLSRTTFTGSRLEPGDKFEETFNGSVFKDVEFDGAELENVSFAGADFTAGGISFDGVTLRNVDFTGAIGLQNIDWGEVTIDGPVYGLSSVAHRLDLDGHPEHLRWRTADGVLPGIDERTGYDVVDGTYVDPATGVNFRQNWKGLYPIDPVSRERLVTPDDHELTYDHRAKRLFDDRNDREYRVDVETGRPLWK